MFTELDNWLFFLFGAFGAGLPLVWLTVRSAVKAGNSVFQKQLDELRGEIHDIRGHFGREFEIVRSAEGVIRAVANRAEKKVDDLTMRVSQLEGGGEE